MVFRRSENSDERGPEIDDGRKEHVAADYAIESYYGPVNQKRIISIVCTNINNLRGRHIDTADVAQGELKIDK